MVNGSEFESFATNSQLGTGLIGYPINCIMGSIGNIICIIIYSRNNMRTSTNTYLAHLAMADLCKLLNDFMYFPTTLLHQYNPVAFKVFYAFYYPFAFFFSQFTATLSAWLTVAVAFERFLMVVYPTCSMGLLTVNKARICTLLITTMVVLLNVPCAMRYRTIHHQLNHPPQLINGTNSTRIYKEWDVETSGLWTNQNFKKTYETAHSCMRSVVPVIILVLLNIRIILSVRQTRANKRLASRNRVTIMLVAVIFCFIFLCLPDAIISILGWGYHEAEDNLKKGIREITDMLLSINSAVNFWLYMSFNRTFLENFEEVFCVIPCLASNKTQSLQERNGTMTEMTKTSSKRTQLDLGNGDHQQQQSPSKRPLIETAAIHPDKGSTEANESLSLVNSDNEKESNLSYSSKPPLFIKQTSVRVTEI